MFVVCTFSPALFLLPCLVLGSKINCTEWANIQQSATETNLKMSPQHEAHIEVKKLWCISFVGQNLLRLATLSG